MMVYVFAGIATVSTLTLYALAGLSRRLINAQREIIAGYRDKVAMQESLLDTYERLCGPIETIDP